MSPRRERPDTGAGVDSPLAQDSGPVRTCVGCRTREPKPALLRVVVVDGVLTVDPGGRLPGRGAHVHPDQVCIDLADKRRAFSRGLRVPGPLDADPVREHVQSSPIAYPKEQVETA